jgi:basic membrane lipoprotein Med (substrate-binding protein (PBP1-ABC) superfamily)
MSAWLLTADRIVIASDNSPTPHRQQCMCRGVASVLLALVFVACGDRDRGGADSARSKSDAFAVALLTPGPISDQSWNGGAYQGLLRIRDSLGGRISHIQTKTPAEFDENFRQYGAQGYTLVFGHGFEFQDAARRVAPEFPRTIYVTTSGTTTGPNLAGIRFAFEEPSYVAGVLAAYMTRSKVLGAIGGTELPPVKESFEAFTNGARSVDPAIRVVTSFIGNWDDVSAGKEHALAQIAQGVDVIFQNADAAGLGVFQAARESGKAWVVGSNADQNTIAPEVTLGSVLIDLPLAFLTVAREVKEGAFQPRVIALGSASHVVRFVPNPVVADRVPARARAAVDSVVRALSDSSLRIPVASRDSAGR